MEHQKDLIASFLRLKRIALVGVSRNPKEFSRTLWSAFRSRGVTCVPVHPVLTEMDGVRCYAHVQEIAPPVEGALILVPREQMETVVEDCIEAGIETVWLYGIRGSRDIPAETLALCAAAGLNVIAGYCPFMFLPDAAFPHRLHGVIWKWLHFYPA